MSDQPRQDDPRKSAGWVDRLADRSTGLPEPQRPTPPEHSPDTSDRAAGWRLAGIGIQFAGTVAIFSLVGYWLDHRFNWTPWSTVTLALVAIVGNVYLLIKEAIKLNK